MLHISYLLLLLVLAIASACDIKTRKIPNGLILTGLVTGVLFSPVGILTKLFGVLFLFFFGMLHLMGMGDIKLWMVILLYLGFANSCFVVATAALLLILYAIWKKPSITKDISVFFQYFLYTKKIGSIEEDGFPFAPFLLASTVLFGIWKVVV